MDARRRHNRRGDLRCLVGRVVACAFSGMMVLVGLPGSKPAHAADASTSVEEWLTQTMKRIIGEGLVRPPTAMPKIDPLRPPPGVLRLSLEQAMALFLKQNLELIIANYGIDAAKGRQITARLFPNPIVGVNTLSAYTQGCTDG